MKRNLFTIGAALLIGFSATAQKFGAAGPAQVEGQANGTTVLLTKRTDWAVIDSAEVSTSLTIVRDMDGIENGVIPDVPNWQGEMYAGSAWNAAGTELTMKFDGSKLKPEESDNWMAVTLSTLQWDGANDEQDNPTLTNKFVQAYSYTETPVAAWNGQPEADWPFTTNPQIRTFEDNMIVRGKAVDLSNHNNAYVTFDYTLDSDAAAVTLQFDLKDILGRAANMNESEGISRVKGSVAPTNEFKTMTLAWDPFAASYTATTPGYAELDTTDGSLSLYSFYDPAFHDMPNPREKVELQRLAESRICGLSIAIFPDQDGLNNTATLVMKNIKIGKYATAGEIPAPKKCEDPEALNHNKFGRCKYQEVGFKTVNGGELQVVNGIVYSAGQIVVTSVTGQVVAVANGEFNTASLKAGIYFVKAAEGTAKIVK